MKPWDAKSTSHWSLTKSSLVSFASAVYGITSSHFVPDSHEGAVIDAVQDAVGPETFRAIVAEQDIERMHSLVTMRLLLETSDGHTQLIGLTAWAQQGFPCVALGHKFAAALLVTSATPEAIAAARPPFYSFVVEVPEGLLYTTDGRTGHRSAVRLMLVHKLFNPRIPSGWGWAYTTYSDDGVSTFRYGVTAEELLFEELNTDMELPGGRRANDDETPFSFELTDEDKRTQAMVGRLIVNMCLAFSDPTNVTVRGDGRKAARKLHRGRVRKSDEPVVRNYFLSKPIVHDFREHVAAYLRGERKAPSIQVLVRGHFKTQHYGPKNAHVKVIWREPFWRGPEDAPIPIRPIQVDEVKS
jgi:hypothetical protein